MAEMNHKSIEELEKDVEKIETDCSFQGSQTRYYYTLEDMMRIFSCGRNTVYKILNTKGFPCLRVGKKYCIPIEPFRKWVNENATAYIATEEKVLAVK